MKVLAAMLFCTFPMLGMLLDEAAMSRTGEPFFTAWERYGAIGVCAAVMFFLLRDQIKTAREERAENASVMRELLEGVIAKNNALIQEFVQAKGEVMGEWRDMKERTFCILGSADGERLLKERLHEQLPRKGR